MHRGSWHYHGRAGPTRPPVQLSKLPLGSERSKMKRGSKGPLSWCDTQYFCWRGRIWVRNCCFILETWQKFSYKSFRPAACVDSSLQLSISAETVWVWQAIFYYSTKQDPQAPPLSFTQAWQDANQGRCYSSLFCTTVSQPMYVPCLGSPEARR